jgi:hypothetical protein
MPVESDAADRSEDPGPGTIARAATGESERERDWALSVERHRKADGRALIIYRWDGAGG